MLNEFKEFAVKGNMVDMAVGIIMGGAFGTIVKSLVDDILMPPIGSLMGGMDFSQLHLALDGNEYASIEAATEAGAATINYGNFINALIAFLIVAICLFFLIKGINQLKRKEEEAPAAPAEPPRQEVLLEEIRDALKKQ
ncbi:MAG: large conductance mechanosensitive channel protein MscL [Aquisalinus sp.]|nr:large conductance mechanosensitive channel protein MscL [Aquisalinus sp.]